MKNYICSYRQFCIALEQTLTNSAWQKRKLSPTEKLLTYMKYKVYSICDQSGYIMSTIVYIQKESNYD